MEEQQRRRGLRGVTPGLQPPAPGCGAAGGSAAGPPSLRLSIASTTGGPLELTVPRGETVEGLRTRISQRLRLRTDRIVLLHKDRHLTAGRLLEHSVTDGSRLTLVPVIEAGLVCSGARAERTTMEVLESLTDVQISDFLSGRSPLTISLRIGAHMMYVQLQLSAQEVKELNGGRESKAARLPPPACPDPTRFGPQRPTTPSVNSLSPAPSPAPPNVPPPSSLPPSCPHPSSPRPAAAAAPVSSSGPCGSSPGPRSPAPASTFSEGPVGGPAPAEPPGAVIETFVSHSPGVFSGTFSGTLAPCSHSGVPHPRRGISIILQILNDLLRAACHHQGAPATLSSAPQHLHPAPEPPDGPPQSEAPGGRGSPATPRAEQGGKPAGDERRLQLSPSEENQTLHCKLERLQRLLHQRRLRRRTRRSVAQASRPYQRRHHHRP